MGNDIFTSIMQSGTTATTVSVPQMLACIGASLALGIVIALAYMWGQRHTRSFALALAMLPSIVCVVIMMVNGNVGAGVAVAGTFSLVRFRSAPGTGRDIAFVFLAMCVGLVTGMGYLALALLVTATIGGAYLLLSATPFGRKADHERTLLVSVPESMDYVGMLDDLLETYTTHHELKSVKTGAMGTVYKLTYSVGSKGATQDKQLIDEIRCRNGNLEVALAEPISEAREQL